MYRALYDYKTETKNYLSFVTGDQFTVIDSKQKDWHLAQNGYGEVGYIPKNYVIREQVDQSEVLLSIDRAIEAIHYQAGSKGGQYTHVQRENLNKLVQHRKSVLDSFRNQAAPSGSAKEQDDDVQLRNKSVRRVAPAPPCRISSVSENKRHSAKRNAENEDCESEISNRKLNSTQSSTEDGFSVHITDTINRVDSASSPINFLTVDGVSKEANCDDEGLVNLRSVDIPEGLGHELIEDVRRNTGLSYPMSIVAVETVLGQIGIKVPEVSTFLDRIFATVNTSQNGGTEGETSSDYRRLTELFHEVTECKDDSQQRGWALHEDEEMINNNLEEMLSILENAKQSISKRAISKDDYECVHTLVQYYQMETRVQIRLTLLKIFNALCVLDGKVISLLLFSILTTELAEELQNNIDNVQRSSYVSLALAMIFSTGETVPANIHDHLNMDFLRFVFDTLENPPTVEHEEYLSDLLVNLILSFNLHFSDVQENLVMRVIAEKSTVKSFSEKILLLFNRGEDPVVMFEHEPRPPNSVMKLLQDMYSNPKTSTVIYTNDEKVLIDIVLGHLVDLSPGDKSRTKHLKLMQLFLTNSEYQEHKHRIAEVKQCMQRIQEEEEDTGDDKNIVSYILKNCHVFNES